MRKKYPFVKQDELKDCGVSSLLMIIKYYNGNILEAKDSGVEFISSDDNFTRLLNQTKTEILNKYLSYKRAFIIAFSGGKIVLVYLGFFMK